jgi:hypothetical protein
MRGNKNGERHAASGKRKRVIRHLASGHSPLAANLEERPWK